MKNLLEALEDGVRECFEEDLPHFKFSKLSFNEGQTNICKGSYDSYSYGGTVEFENLGLDSLEYVFISNYLLHKGILTRALVNDDISGEDYKKEVEVLVSRTAKGLSKYLSNRGGRNEDGC